MPFFKISVNSLENLIYRGSSCFELVGKLLLLVMTSVLLVAADYIKKNLPSADPTSVWG